MANNTTIVLRGKSRGKKHDKGVLPPCPYSCCVYCAVTEVFVSAAGSKAKLHPSHGVSLTAPQLFVPCSCHHFPYFNF